MLDIQRKYELETALHKVDLPQCYITTMSEQAQVALENYIEDSGLVHEEVIYLVDAYYMPMDEILNDVEVYEGNKNNMSYGTFITSLAKKYGVSNEHIIYRIAETRQIDEYKKSIKQKKIGSK